MIHGPLAFLFCVARLDGFRAAMNAAGVPIDLQLVRSSTLYVDGGRRDALELLKLREPPTAIFAANDLQALGIYQAARELGVRIPEDLSVVGFDDLPFTEWAGPPMTTVRQPLEQMAAAGARMVVALARGETLEQQRVELATTLVVRQSTAPPRRI